MTPVIDNPGQYLPGVPLPARLKLHPVSPLDNLDTLILPDATVQAALGKHPIGFNVRPGVDYAKLLTQVKAMGGCRAMVFHEYAGNLPKLRPFVEWVDTLIWRPAEWVSERLYLDYPDGTKWLSAQIDAMKYAGFIPDDLWLHLHNESGWNAEMVNWERRVIEDGISIGVNYVALNQAVGNPNEQQLTLARPILELASQYPEQVMIGIHDGYFSVFGGRKYPWYLGRWQASSDELNGGHSYESYRQQLGLGPVRYVITEAGAEDIADDHPYTDNLPRTGDRTHVGPVHANDAAWASYYGAAYLGKDAQYLAELKTAWDVGRWGGDSRIAGVCLFSWGAQGWPDYDVSEMGDWQKLVAGWRPMVAQPIEPPEDAGVPTLPGKDSSMWMPGRLLTSAQGSNLRDAPFYMPADGHVPGVVLVNLKDNAKVAVWLEPNYEADGKRWYGVKHVTDAGKVLIGWMALVAPSFEAQFALDDPVPEPPVDPPPPTEETPGESDGNPTLTAEDVRAIVREELAALMSIVLELINTSVIEYSEQRAAESRIITTVMDKARTNALDKITNLKEIA